MIKYSIKDLEKITGIKAHTIRIWEKRYGIVEPSRTQTNIRYYSDEHLRHLMNVAILNKFGYKISNIQEMTPDEITETVLGLSKQYIDNEHQIDNLVMAMIEIDEARFNKIISSAISNQGFEYTFENLLLKFLERIGILWQIGAINPAQEHFISQLIRTKLLMAIDSQPEPHGDFKTFLLFLPENEYHELALLYIHFLIRKQRHKVIYLGQNVPLVNLQNVMDIHNVDYVVTSITSNLPVEMKTETIHELEQLYGDKKVLIGGNCLFESGISLPSNFKYINSLHDFNDFIRSI